MKQKFRFGIMGAAKIAYTFCSAIAFIEDAEVVAVSSKDLQRAQEFAEKNNIAHAYDDYETMLKTSALDCVYIAVTQNAHYDLTMLCLDYGVPVLCEKAMFLNSIHAQTVFQRAASSKVFVMEAMWSRFLPAHKKALEWIQRGQIGELLFIDAEFGFLAPHDPNNRYFSPALGGGTSYDLTVYAYELARFYCNQPIRNKTVHALWGETGVDVTNHVAIQFDTVLASLKTSFVMDLGSQMVLYGENGKIVLPNIAGSTEAYLYRNGSPEPQQHFLDDQTKNGFVYEVQEVMHCVCSGKLESSVVPHELTLSCAKLFDLIEQTKPFT